MKINSMIKKNIIMKTERSTPKIKTEIQSHFKSSSIVRKSNNEIRPNDYEKSVTMASKVGKPTSTYIKEIIKGLQSDRSKESSSLNNSILIKTKIVDDMVCRNINKRNSMYNIKILKAYNTKNNSCLTIEKNCSRIKKSKPRSNKTRSSKRSSANITKTKLLYDIYTSSEV